MKNTEPLKIQTKTTDEESFKPKRSFIKSVIKIIRDKLDRDDILTDFAKKELEKQGKLLKVNISNCRIIINSLNPNSNLTRQ